MCEYVNFVNVPSCCEIYLNSVAALIRPIVVNYKLFCLVSGVLVHR